MIGRLRGARPEPWPWWALVLAPLWLLVVVPAWAAAAFLTSALGARAAVSPAEAVLVAASWALVATCLLSPFLAYGLLRLGHGAAGRLALLAPVAPILAMVVLAWLGQAPV